MTSGENSHRILGVKGLRWLIIVFKCAVSSWLKASTTIHLLNRFLERGGGGV